MKKSLLLILLLAACGKSEPPAPVAVTPAVKATASAPVDSGEAPQAPADYEVDEPLPPFDEGPRPKLVARAPVSSGGTMTIYEAGDGSRLLRFEDLSVSNEPGLEIVLLAAMDAAGGQRIAALKGSRGNQNYLLGRDLRLKPGGAIGIVARNPDRVLATAALTPP